MKASIVSKLILVLCILCLFIGFLPKDRHSNYIQNSKKHTPSVRTTANKVAVLELEGIITTSYESNFLSKEKNANTLLKTLTALQEDNEIRGVIIKINSPGGTVAASQNIYNQVKKLREIKPVLVVIDDICASGGYYIASAADRIIAQEGSLTGSIGVIFSFFDYHDLLINKLSVNPVVIKSGKYKDIASGTRTFGQDERALMQNIIDDSYSQFINAIINGRVKRIDKYAAEKTQLTEKVLRQYADGRVFTGKQAQKLGFVDVIGDLDTAKSLIEIMSQEKFENKLPVKLVTYSKKSLFGEYFSSITETSSQMKFGIDDLLPTSTILSKRPLYLWE